MRFSRKHKIVFLKWTVSSQKSLGAPLNTQDPYMTFDIHFPVAQLLAHDLFFSFWTDSTSQTLPSGQWCIDYMYRVRNNQIGVRLAAHRTQTLLRKCLVRYVCVDHNSTLRDPISMQLRLFASLEYRVSLSLPYPGSSQRHQDSQVT